MIKTEHLIGYVKASSYRKKILKSLEHQKLTPVEMARETGIPLSHVSNTLTELLKKKLVICLTPELKKGRIYDLTREGRSVFKYVM